MVDVNFKSCFLLKWWWWWFTVLNVHSHPCSFFIKCSSIKKTLFMNEIHGRDKICNHVTKRTKAGFLPHDFTKKNLSTTQV